MIKKINSYQQHIKHHKHDIVFFSAQTSPLKPDSLPLTTIIIIVAVAAGIVIVTIVTVAMICSRRKTKKNKNENGRNTTERTGTFIGAYF